MPFESETLLDEGFLDPTACNGTNRLEIFVFGHETQMLLVARLDNLGQGRQRGGRAVHEYHDGRG